MKKIIVDKGEGIAEVIDHILEHPDDEIAVVVPRGSVLGRSARNFHILRQEAENAGKHIQVESVDEQILALANDAGLGGAHPLFHKAATSVSDIVSVSSGNTKKSVTASDERKTSTSKKKSSQSMKEDLVISEREESVVHLHHSVQPEEEAREIDEQDEVATEEDDFGLTPNDERKEAPYLASLNRFFKPTKLPDDIDESSSSRRRISGKALTIGLIVLLGAIVAFTVVNRFFAHADVSITFKKTPWQYQSAFTADASIAKVTPGSTVIPAQVFTENKNVTQLFPASGSNTVSQKAAGTITIYNAYSSAPQSLVASTRFTTSDGKIFRLTSNVIVPGAKIANGQITPSSVNATVAADQAGPSYNVGPVAKLLIPGFQGGPKYDAFYGSIASGTAGGFVGTKAVATPQDIANAQASTTALLQGALANTASMSIPSNFKILDGATAVRVGKLVVATSTDASGNFSVFGQAAYQAVGFDEPSLKELLLEQAQATEPSSTFSDLNITYSNVKPDFTNSKLSFSLSATGSLEPQFSVDDFKALVAGQGISTVQSDISALPNLSEGKISVWPVWLWSLPGDPGRISVDVK